MSVNMFDGYGYGYIDVLDRTYLMESITHKYGCDEVPTPTIEIEAVLVGKKNLSNPFTIKKVHFNDPATIVIWADGTKTVVKCSEEDIYDPQTGLLMCIAKKAYGNKGKFNDILREWVPEEEEEDDGFSIWELFGVPKTYTFECELTPEVRKNFEKLAYGGKAND